MNTLLNISCLQYDIAWEDSASNLKKIENLLRDSKVADLIVLPEMFSTGFTTNINTHTAQSMEGTSCSWMKKLAISRKALVLGTLIIKKDKRFYNRMIACKPDGNISHYDKNYLYSPAGEDQVYTSGTKRTIIDFKGWRICPLICYDLRFAVHAQNNENIDLYVYSANWPLARIHHWKSLLAARAIENQAYVVGLNRIGVDGNQLRYNGQSRVIDYHGKVLLDMKDAERIDTTALSLQDLRKYRNKYPFLEDQR